MTAQANDYSDVTAALEQARERGDIKEASCRNACRWLGPSFSAVEVDGRRVGDHIRMLVEERRWGELDDAFFQVNAFGTAGVRGRLAIGTAYFNTIILSLGVEAHARYITGAYAGNGRQLGREMAVVLAYDSRRGSYDPQTGGPGFLVRDAASIYAAHDIRVYLFDSVAPTPELSFAIAELEDIRPYAGGVFTASHNPAADNGFKPYDYYGGQIVHSGVQRIADNIQDYGQVRRMPFEECVRRGLVRMIGPEADAAYIEKENQTAVWTDARGRFRTDMIATDLRVVFSSLNGTSQRLVPRVLERRGFAMENLICVEEQCVPDGSFETCKKPNPEEKQALERAVRLAAEARADMVIATDPDSDRIGVGVRPSDEELEAFGDDAALSGCCYLLSGNQQLVLLTDYILGQLSIRDGRLPRNALVSKTLVSTDLARSIAAAYGVMTVEPHVGFKFLGEKLALYAEAAFSRAREESPGEYDGRDYRSLSRAERCALLERHSLCCLFGGEESYGSLVGDYVKDKDAVTVCAMFVEMAGFYRLRGTTLLGRLRQIWEQYGYWREETISLKYEGAAGNDIIRAIMRHCRETPWREIAGKSVIAAVDYLTPANSRHRTAVDPEGRVLFDDSPPPDDGSHDGYVDVQGIRIPHFWHGDLHIIGEKARLGEANVFMYVLADGSKVIMRPSGTEPKIKFYILAKGTSADGKGSSDDRRQVDGFFEEVRRHLMQTADRIAAGIG